MSRESEVGRWVTVRTLKVLGAETPEHVQSIVDMPLPSVAVLSTLQLREQDSVENPPLPPAA